MATARSKCTAALLAAALLALTTAAGAQPFDHLKCYKIKDLAPKVKYTVDLSPEQTQFLAQSGCELKVPAKLFCVDTEKSNVVPAAPLVVNGQSTRDFLCYNLKCPALPELPLNVEDQFGTRSIKVKKKPFQLCAPARVVGDPDPPTPTACLAPTATPTPPAPTCTDLTQNGGETDIDCGGPCLDCVNGEGCLVDGDCQSNVCTSGTCTFCSPGQTLSCGTMQPGICAAGTHTCLAPGNAFGPCTGPPPQTETCNGLDDNCDAVVDNACPPIANGSGACAGPSCSYSCNTGFSDCNAVLADGCEASLNTDFNNCGSCGHICSGNNGIRSCAAGTCQITCNPGFANCNGNAGTDGCEINLTNNNANCGGCGTVCPGITNCIGSVCQ